MQTARKTYYKALFLLLVFSMNTAVSFACSLSGYVHALHHNSFASAATQDPASQKHEETFHHEHDCHTVPDAPLPDENKKDDCCTKYAIEIQKVEKAVSKTIDAPEASFITSFIASFISLTGLEENLSPVYQPDNARWRIPGTIQDLRIAIQSFQI